MRRRRRRGQVVLASGQTYTLTKYQWDDGGLKDTTRYAGPHLTAQSKRRVRLDIGLSGLAKG